MSGCIHAGGSGAGELGPGNEIKNLTHALSHTVKNLYISSSISLAQQLALIVHAFHSYITLQLRLARTNGEGRQARRFRYDQRQVGHVLEMGRGW